MQWSVTTHSTNPAVLKLKYDPIADFAPVGMTAQTSDVLVVAKRTRRRACRSFGAGATESGGMNQVMQLN